MLNLLGKTQQSILQLLNNSKDGLSNFQLAELLKLSRTAITQHLTSLQNSNLIEFGAMDKTGGRPSQKYILTLTAKELFPRQYSLFAKMLVETLQDEKGHNGLEKIFQTMSKNISKKYLPLLNSMKPKQRVEKVAEILSDLGYEAEVVAKNEKKEGTKIEISNCVYHNLAISCNDICSFDKNVIEKLTGKEVAMDRCITLGSDKCSFTLKK